jgi:hypothetical protein
MVNVMNIESISQKPFDDDGSVFTEVVLNNVESQCLLTRSAIKALGRPGADTDLSFFGSGDQWTLMWSYPTFTLEETRELVATIIQSL